MNKKRNELAPCGVFCAACPSFDKSCNGCSSEDKNQKRKSKWNCNIRKCCYDMMHFDYCGYCKHFPCEIINRKLIHSHKGEKRFTYRHEIEENMKKLNKMGIDRFIKVKKNEYTCPNCKGIIHFYHYKCSTCGKEVKVLKGDEEQK